MRPESAQIVGGVNNKQGVDTASEAKTPSKSSCTKDFFGLGGLGGLKGVERLLRAYQTALASKRMRHGRIEHPLEAMMGKRECGAGL